MRTIVVAVLAAFLAVFAAGLVLAGTEKPSIEKGKALFNEVQPGITGKTCANCHKDGQGLEAAGSRDDLPAMINKCMVGGLKGKAMAIDSVEMQSLIMYIKDLAGKQKAPVGC
jgi:cytochrome c